MALPDPLCASRAGLFRNFDDENTAFLLWFSFLFLSFLTTACIRWLVLGRPMPVPPNATPPATMICLRCQHIDDALLPPPPSPSSESKRCLEDPSASVKRRMSQTPSIRRFITCTTLAILNILSMVLMALATQSLLYCGSLGDPESYNHVRRLAIATFGLWFMYAVAAAWVSSGLSCWAMWARNLWGGPGAAERWPIRSDLGAFVLLGAFTVLAIPFILVLLVAIGVWKGLCRCFCGKPLKRADAEVVEMETV